MPATQSRHYTGDSQRTRVARLLKTSGMSLTAISKRVGVSCPIVAQINMEEGKDGGPIRIYKDNVASTWTVDGEKREAD